MKDKEKIEITRLKNRVGGFQKYVDQANLHNPDPISTHYLGGKYLTRFITTFKMLVF